MGEGSPLPPAVSAVLAGFLAVGDRWPGKLFEDWRAKDAAIGKDGCNGECEAVKEFAHDVLSSTAPTLCKR